MAKWKLSQKPYKHLTKSKGVRLEILKSPKVLSRTNDEVTTPRNIILSFRDSKDKKINKKDRDASTERNKNHTEKDQGIKGQPTSQQLEKKGEMTSNSWGK